MATISGLNTWSVETSNEIVLRGRRASHSKVAVTQKISETDIEGNDDAQLAVEACAVTAQPTTEASNVITLPSVRLDVQREALEAGGQSIPARVIDFPSRTTMSEQNDKDELGLNEKRRIVADELYEMFMATLEDAPVDTELVDELYRVFLKKRKKASLLSWVATHDPFVNINTSTFLIALLHLR